MMSGAQPTHSDEGANTLHQASSSGSAQPVVSAGSTISKSLTDGQSAVATSDAGMKETCDKPGTEITKTSTIAHQTSQDVEKAKGREATSVPSADGRTGPTACSSAPPVTNLVKSKENMKELPVIKAHEPGLIQGTKTQHVDKKVRPGLESQYFKFDQNCICAVVENKRLPMCYTLPICSNNSVSNVKSSQVSLFYNICLFRVPAAVTHLEVS